MAKRIRRSRRDIGRGDGIEARTRAHAHATTWTFCRWCLGVYNLEREGRLESRGWKDGFLCLLFSTPILSCGFLPLLSKALVSSSRSVRVLIGYESYVLLRMLQLATCP